VAAVDKESATGEASDLEDAGDAADEGTGTNTHFNTGAIAGASAGAAGILLVAVGAGVGLRYRRKKAQEERNRLLKADTVLDIGYVHGPPRGWWRHTRGSHSY
jgi:LPXTG-motif cell wall-anchored protein